MKRHKLTLFIIILLLVALLAPMIISIGSALAFDDSSNASPSFDLEGVEPLAATSSEEAIGATGVEMTKMMDIVNFSESLEITGASSFTEVMSLNEHVEEVNHMQRLRDVIIDFNRNPSQFPNPVIRITRDIFWGDSGASGFIQITHPNLVIEAGAGNFTIHTTGNGAFMPLSGGRLTLRGGSRGGSLAIQGNFVEGNGIFVRSSSTATVQSNVSITGFPSGGVRIGSGGTFNLTGNARIYRNRNRSGQGGGVQVETGGTFNMSGGIIDFNTGVNGGGVYVANGGVFSMTGGQISNNFSVHGRNFNTGQITSLGGGGGLFVPTSNLPNITITSAAIFKDNVAESGIRVDNDLAEEYWQTIRPGTVSVTELGLYIKDDGSYSNEAPHAFTNYDINTSEEIPILWKVTYETKGNLGKILAKFEDTEEEIPSGTYVPEGSKVIFIPEPSQLLNRWEIGTRTTEIDEEGGVVPFTYVDGGSGTPLSVIVEKHTNVIGYFSIGFTITKDPNDGVGEPLVRWVLPGSYQLSHIPTHHNEAFLFTGWNTLANGTGVSYGADEIINVPGNTTLYAQWALAATSLTITKEVTGALGNKYMPFNFEIYFTTSSEKPLSSERPLHYTITNGDKEIISEGTRTLDDSGKIGFQLAHGHTIHIEEIPLGGFIQILEIPVIHYVTSIEDSENLHFPTGVNDTGILPMTPNRVFGFTNERVDVPPAAVDLGNIEALHLLAILTSVSVLSLFTCRTIYQRVR